MLTKTPRTFRSNRCQDSSGTLTQSKMLLGYPFCALSRLFHTRLYLEPWLYQIRCENENYGITYPASLVQNRYSGRFISLPPTGGKISGAGTMFQRLMNGDCNHSVPLFLPLLRGISRQTVTVPTVCWIYVVRYFGLYILDLVHYYALLGPLREKAKGQSNLLAMDGTM